MVFSLDSSEAPLLVQSQAAQHRSRNGHRTGKEGRGRLSIRRRQPLPLASLSASNVATASADQGQGGRGRRWQLQPPALSADPRFQCLCTFIYAGAKVPLFMIASASETKEKSYTDPNAPAWRVAVGNLGAGAVAGCAVEAGMGYCCTRLRCEVGSLTRLRQRRVLASRGSVCPHDLSLQHSTLLTPSRRAYSS